MLEVGLAKEGPFSGQNGNFQIFTLWYALKGEERVIV
jgi:hypothetical protein